MKTLKEIFAANRNMIIAKLDSQLGNGTKETLAVIMNDFFASATTEHAAEPFTGATWEIEGFMQSFICDNRGNYSDPVQLNYDVMNMHKANVAACMGKI